MIRGSARQWFWLRSFRLVVDKREPLIKVIHEDTGAVVTIIEGLSPSNKVGVVREGYLRRPDADLVLDLKEISSRG